MTTTLLFERHVIDTYDNQTRELDFHQKSIVSLTGPSGSGKTSMIQTMLYALGINGRFRRAVRENVRSASTTINVSGASYRLVRSMARRTNLIQVYDGQSPERLLNLDLAGEQGPPPSQWLFEQLGIEKLFANVRLPGRGGRAATLEDLLPVCYINQDDTDRQIMRHQTHDSARKTILELLLGISDASVEEAKNRLADAVRQLSELKKSITTIEGFLAEDPADADQLHEELRTATADAKNAAERLKALRKQAKAASRSDPSRDGRSDWRECPRCRADLSERVVDDGQCQLCLQPETLDDALALCTGTASHGNEITDTLNPDTLAQAEAEAARTDERVKGLKRVLEPHQRLARFHDKRNKLEAERTDAAAALNQAKESASQYRNCLSDFNDSFLDVVRELRPPWFERNAYIDFNTYLPIVEGDNFDGLGGGVRGTINIAYHVALLSLALVTGVTYVPSILIIDSPRRNLGSNAIDKALAQRIYEHFQKLAEARISAGLDARPFQLIIADNDLPSVPIQGIRQIRFDHDKPFVPGVHYTANAQGDIAE